MQYIIISKTNEEICLVCTPDSKKLLSELQEEYLKIGYDIYFNFPSISKVLVLEYLGQQFKLYSQTRHEIGCLKQEIIKQETLQELYKIRFNTNFDVLYQNTMYFDVQQETEDEVYSYNSCLDFQANQQLQWHTLIQTLTKSEKQKSNYFENILDEQQRIYPYIDYEQASYLTTDTLQQTQLNKEFQQMLVDLQ